MEKPLLILKPSLVNAILPTFLRNLFYAFILVLILFGIAIVLETFNIVDYPNKVLWLLGLLLVISIGSVLVKIINLFNTSYYFFKTHVSREFEFFTVKKQSAPYSQIVNISVDISIWDRVCNAGDITLHTAEDVAPDLILHFIKEPEKIERGIYNLIHRVKKPTP